MTATAKHKTARIHYGKVLADKCCTYLGKEKQKLPIYAFMLTRLKCARSNRAKDSCST